MSVTPCIIAMSDLFYSASVVQTPRRTKATRTVPSSPRVRMMLRRRLRAETKRLVYKGMVSDLEHLF